MILMEFDLVEQRVSRDSFSDTLQKFAKKGQKIGITGGYKSPFFSQIKEAIGDRLSPEEQPGKIWLYDSSKYNGFTYPVTPSWYRGRIEEEGPR